VDRTREIEALRAYLRAPEHRVGGKDSTYVHRAALRAIWEEALHLTGGRIGEALHVCSIAVRSGQQPGESRADYLRRLDGIPSKVFETGWPGAAPRVDLPQHFFASAELAYAGFWTGPASAELRAKLAGRLWELKDRLEQVRGTASGSYDRTDINADDRGAEFGGALAASQLGGAGASSVEISTFFFGGDEGPDAGVNQQGVDAGVNQQGVDAGVSLQGDQNLNQQQPTNVVQSVGASDDSGFAQQGHSNASDELLYTPADTIWSLGPGGFGDIDYDPSQPVQDFTDSSANMTDVQGGAAHIDHSMVDNASFDPSGGP
jgi:hypothetical protein